MNNLENEKQYIKDLNACLIEFNNYINKNFLNNGENNNNGKKKGSIVFDIDDTLISTKINKDGSYEIFPVAHSENKYLTTIKIYKKLCNTNNYNMHLITARPEASRGNTIEMLKRNDIKYDSLHLRPNNCKCICLCKEKFRGEIEELYKNKILLTVGDQITDMLGGYFSNGWKLPSKYNGDCVHAKSYKQQNK